MKKALWAVLCAVILLGGCGNDQVQEKYDAGMKAFEAQDYDTAILQMDEVTQAGKRLAEAYRIIGLSRMEKEEYPEAVAAFMRSLNYMDAPNAAFERDVRLYLAQARIAGGDTEKGIEVYSEVLRAGEDTECFYLRGKAYLSLNDYEHAEKDFVRALKDCADYDLYINIYELYAQKNKTVDGDAYLQMALALEPETGEDYYQHGRIYEYQKNYESARDELITAIQLGQDEAVLLLGRVYLEMEDSASARSMYQDYLNESEHDAQAYNGLAMCDIYEGNYEAAMEKVQSGLAVGTEEEQQGLLYNEIVIYEYQRNFDLAKEKMEQYLAKYPDDAEALRENEFLSTR